ncbi:MAG: hypothetical protein QXX68_00850 [Candidatus Pacearchaeota archaeon]
MPKKPIGKDEDLELAEEHLKLAEDLVNEEAKKCEETGSCSERKKKALLKAQFEIEKAETELEEGE